MRLGMGMVDECEWWLGNGMGMMDEWERRR
nr:MAG TPA: hypothetical protein [Caudoviricetes sp.]